MSQTIETDRQTDLLQSRLAKTTKFGDKSRYSTANASDDVTGSQLASVLHLASDL